MSRRHALSALVTGMLVWTAPAFAAAPMPQVDVFKSPYCGCCGAWVEHMKAAGFVVKVTEVTDTTAARKRLGLPDTYGSCHTATVGGYVLEGHVAAASCHPANAKAAARWHACGPRPGCPRYAPKRAGDGSAWAQGRLRSAAHRQARQVVRLRQLSEGLKEQLMKKQFIAIGALAVSLGLQAQTSAADHASHHSAEASAAAPQAAVTLTAGEVRRIDLAQKKVTLRHGPIVNLDMPAMTMVFQVADAQLLNNLSVGDKVRFAVEKQQGVFMVTALEKASE